MEPRGGGPQVRRILAKDNADRLRSPHPTLLSLSLNSHSLSLKLFRLFSHTKQLSAMVGWAGGKTVVQQVGEAEHATISQAAVTALPKVRPNQSSLQDRRNQVSSIIFDLLGIEPVWLLSSRESLATRQRSAPSRQGLSKRKTEQLPNWPTHSSCCVQRATALYYSRART